MELISQSHTIIDEPNPYKLIELAGRICWKSEDKILPDSDISFISKLVKMNHLSVIEHGYIAFKVSFTTIRDIKLTLRYHNFLDNIIDDTFITTSSTNSFIVSANFRAWKEFFTIPGALNSPGVKSIARYLNINYPEIFQHIDDLQDNAKPISAKDMTTDERTIHTVRSIKIVTDRGVSHEICRHRPMAISQESTRYVKYDDNIKFILPIGWKDQPDDAQKRFVYFCDYCEQKYIELLNFGWQPQQARAILPNSLKTELIITGTLRQWFHIFKLRCHRSAHPQIRALMQNILKDFILDEPEIFKQQKRLLT